MRRTRLLQRRTANLPLSTGRSTRSPASRVARPLPGPGLRGRARAVAPIAALALCAVASAGCDALQSGNEDKLAFEFVTTDRLLPVSFGTPLATGLSIDVAVYVAGTARTPATLTLAQSRDQAVARVTATDGNRFTLNARRAGTSLIETVSPAGNDTFDLAVVDIARVDLAYPGKLLSPATPPVSVLLGGTARFGVTLKAADDRLLVGYGAFPVTLSPETAAAAVATESTGHYAVRFDEAGAVTLSPEGGDALEVTVVPLDAVDALNVTLTGEATIFSVGERSAILVDARDEFNQPIFGLTGVLAVTTTTPSVCTVSQSHLLDDAAFELLGIAPGVCSVTATLGAFTETVDMEFE